MSKLLVVSYVPGLDLDEPKFLNAKPEEIKKHLPEMPDANIEGCVWFGTEEQGIMPGFIIEKAEEVRNHITRWSENKPKEYFYVSYYHDQENYAIGLFPNLEASKERNRLAYKILHMKDLPDDTEYVFLFVPWLFLSPKPGQFPMVVKEIEKKKKLSVAFVEKSTFDPQHPEKMTYYTIDDIEISLDGYYIQHIKNELERMNRS